MHVTTVSTAPPTGAEPEPEAELTLVVADRDHLAEGVVRLTLARPDGGELPGWQPGAHVDLHLASGLVRQYSLCSDPGDRTRWQVAVLRARDGRGGSAEVHDRLAAGDPVRVRGPRNNFPLHPAPRHLFLAGGIGITPIRPMVRQAEQRGGDWELVYGGRSLATMAFHAELRQAYGDRVRLVPEDREGLPDLDALLGTPRPGTLVYCCGPEGLLRAVEERCASWPAGALRVERFAPKSAVHATEGEFEVELARSGRTLTVPPGTSVLDAVERAGVQVLSSCREGTCGTCETTVLAGTVDHRDSLLTPDEQAAHDTMMICVSRAACPRLVLDL
ncbi:oxidoreductase [Streptomyces spinoverrucosus]|uniref:PDR/VanB family oxidoreductase n=1 Tax=Streptomyces spinoverrucosus TaxID=284043 RepID=UPI0018C3A98B|nr:PDR/VanB family oxidoreductase [Streptomyces spinoverrucosus]MBG0851870.1 oxidoreductase [Streptomyces spinoverrucosus]